MRTLIVILIGISAGWSISAAVGDPSCATTTTVDKETGSKLTIRSCRNVTSPGSSGSSRAQDCPPITPGETADYHGSIGCSDGDGQTWIHCGGITYWAVYIQPEERNGEPGYLWSSPGGTCWLPYGAPGTPPALRIREAVREVPLPGLAVTVQPATRTLVNADTIVYAEPTPVNKTVPILGYRVRIHAVATTYRWRFGDGTTQTTTSPGAPYPDETVTHRYQHVAAAVAISVTVGYHVRYSTDGGPWEELGEPLYATGPTSTLRVDEAQAVLIAP